MTSSTAKLITTTCILSNITSKDNQTMKFGQKYNMRNIFLEKSDIKGAEDTCLDASLNNHNWAYL